MNRGILYMSLALACSLSCDLDEYPWLEYSMSWTCLSPDGCERAEQVALVDRVAILEKPYNFCEFWSTRNAEYRWFADLLDSDSLPPDCYLMTGFAIFGYEPDAPLLCRTESGFTLELSILNQDNSKYSRWRIEGQYIGRLADVPL